MGSRGIRRVAAARLNKERKRARCSISSPPAWSARTRGPSAEGESLWALCAFHILKADVYHFFGYSFYMGSLLGAIRNLVENGNVKISDHGYDELANDGIYVRDVVSSIDAAVLVQEYPDYRKGSCILVLQQDRTGAPMHVVWGIPSGRNEPAVLVTAYRPDTNIWEDDFLRRKR